MLNIDPQEIQNFNDHAAKWWDKTGPFKALHDINPLRLQFIMQAIGLLQNKKILDVGCGGGILAESLAWQGGDVTGIDPADKAIAIAQQHAAESPQLTLQYEQTTVEEMLERNSQNGEQATQFDILTCMEMLEHVPNPAKLVQDCAQLVKPGGHLFFSTINRNLKSWALAIIAAEYVLKLLPKGMHEYEKFIRPSEFATWARAAKLSTVQISGFSYNPWTRHCALSSEPHVNYLVHCRKP